MSVSEPSASEPRRVRRWLPVIPAVIVAAIIFVLSSIPGNELAGHVPFDSDKLAHGLAYAVFGASVAYPVSRSRRFSVPLAGLIVVMLIGVAYGISDEIHQMFTPMRSPDPLDVVADGVGAILGAVLFFVLRRWVVLPRSSKEKSQ